MHPKSSKNLEPLSGGEREALKADPVLLSKVSKNSFKKRPDTAKVGGENKNLVVASLN